MKAEQCLQGRRVVVTGAGRGLGRAFAIVAADHGAEPVLLGRDASALNAVAGTIRERCGRDSQVIACDLANATSISSACRAVLYKDPRIDTLINNGAPWLEGKLDEISDDDIATTIAATVTGTILVTKGLLPGLYRSRCPDIVTIVSTSGIPGRGLDGVSVPFYAAKHGQSGFSDKLRQELQGTGIRVTAVYPPDFDDVDPLAADWERVYDADARISSRDVVSALLYILTAPRTCSFPAVVLEGTSTGAPVNPVGEPA